MDNNKTINIPRKMNDPYYRYKRHQMKAKMDGGTNLLNLEVIAKDLQRNAEDLLKYIGIETATHSFQKNKGYRLKGNFSIEKLEMVIEKYIDQFVICKKCSKPDTFICLDSKKNLFVVCTACGNHNRLENRTKYVDYLTKNCTNRMPDEKNNNNSKGNSKKKNSRESDIFTEIDFINFLKNETVKKNR